MIVLRLAQWGVALTGEGAELVGISAPVEEMLTNKDSVSKLSEVITED